MATEVITSLVQKLYEVAQTVQGNKESCKEINERAQRLIPALARIASSPAKNNVSQHDTSEKLLLFLPPPFFCALLLLFTPWAPVRPRCHRCILLNVRLTCIAQTGS